jgi:CheY-like chemotaxis protein
MEPLQRGRMGSPLRILLVEDHVDTSHAMSRLLRALNHDVLTADTCASALAIAQKHPIDVLISDLGLPDRSGLELMRELKAAYNIPGIALTGYAMPEDIDNSRAAGFDLHLTKPIRLETLATILNEFSHARS